MAHDTCRRAQAGKFRASGSKQRNYYPPVKNKYFCGNLQIITRFCETPKQTSVVCRSDDPELKRLPLAPAQLASKCVEEATFTEPNELDGVPGPLAAYFIADPQFESCLAVDGEQTLGWNTLYSHRQIGIPAQDNGAQRQQVGTDWRNDQCVHIGR